MTMLSSTSLQLVLLIGEILIAVKLDTRILSWSAIFTPFYILVILSSVSCVLSCCCCRKFSIEVSVVTSFFYGSSWVTHKLQYCLYPGLNGREVQVRV